MSFKAVANKLTVTSFALVDYLSCRRCVTSKNEHNYVRQVHVSLCASALRYGILQIQKYYSIESYLSYKFNMYDQVDLCSYVCVSACARASKLCALIVKLGMGKSGAQVYQTCGTCAPAHFAYDPKHDGRKCS